MKHSLQSIADTLSMTNNRGYCGTLLVSFWEQPINKLHKNKAHSQE